MFFLAVANTRADPPCLEGWLPSVIQEMPGTVGVSRCLASWDSDGDGPLAPLLVVGGTLQFAGGTAVSNIAAWDPNRRDGRGEWITLGDGFNNWVRYLSSWDPDGEGEAPPLLVASGSFTHSGTTPINRIAVWVPARGQDPGRWLQMGNGFNAAPILLQWDRDGDGPSPNRFVAIGPYSTNRSDDNEGDEGDEAVRNLWHLRWWEPTSADGADGFWSTFAPSAYSIRGAMTWDPDGSGPMDTEIVIAGLFVHAGDVRVNHIAAWSPGEKEGEGRWRDLGGGTDRSVLQIAAWDHDANRATPDQIFALGIFQHAGSVETPYGAAWWDQSAMNGLGEWRWAPPLYSFPYGLNFLGSVDPDGEGPIAPRLAASYPSFFWEGLGLRLGWLDLDANNGQGAWRPFGPRYNVRVTSTVHWDEDGDGPAEPSLILGGDSAYGAARLASLDSSGPDLLDTTLAPLSDGLVGTPIAAMTWDHDQNVGTLEQLVIAGSFMIHEGSSITRNCARWEPDSSPRGGHWRDIGTTEHSGINDLSRWDISEDGTARQLLVALGYFYDGTGDTYFSIGYKSPLIDGTDQPWKRLGGGELPIGAPTSHSVWVPAVDDSRPPRLVVAGGYNAGTISNRMYRTRFQCIDATQRDDSNGWCSLGESLAGYAYAMTSMPASPSAPDAGFPIAGGDLRPDHDSPMRGVYRWHSPSNSWVPLTKSINGAVRALVVWDPDDQGPHGYELVAGGDFTEIDGFAASRVARWIPQPTAETGRWEPMASGVNASPSFLAPWDPDGYGPQRSVLIAAAYVGTGDALLQWDPSGAQGGGAWSQFLQGTSSRDLTSAFAWDPDGTGILAPRLLVTGWFFGIDHVPAIGVGLYGRDCACPGDADGDHVVSFTDVTAMLNSWSTAYPIATGVGDASRDGKVDFGDLLAILAHYGIDCR